MKKAKVILSAVAVFAIIGGALAFKAKRSDFIYYTTTQGASNCPITVSTLFTTNTTTVPYVTVATSTNCALTTSVRLTAAEG